MIRTLRRAAIAFAATAVCACTALTGWTPPQPQSGDGWHLVETYREPQGTDQQPLVGIVVLPTSGPSTDVLLTVQSGGGDCLIPVFHGLEAHVDENVVTARFDRVNKPGSGGDPDRCMSAGQPITFRVSIDRHPVPLPYVLQLDDSSLKQPCEVTCGAMSVTIEPKP